MAPFLNNGPRMSQRSIYPTYFGGFRERQNWDVIKELKTSHISGNHLVHYDYASRLW